MRKILALLMVGFLVWGCKSSLKEEKRIRCASTTSIQNSGLWQYLVPIIQKNTGITVDVVAVGTGAALELGKRGDVDMVLVHAKEDELALVAQGYFVNRHDLMYNDFVIIGPKSDPAGIRGVGSVLEALKKIEATSSVFVSRGDQSGTHKRETTLWQKTGLNPKGKRWYLEVGQGMGKTQRIANEKQAYSLTDRGTWLALKDKDRLELEIMVQGDALLVNQYGVMAVNPQKFSSVKFDLVKSCINFLISPQGQRVIAAYRDSNGTTLFYPNAGAP